MTMAIIRLNLFDLICCAVAFNKYEGNQLHTKTNKMYKQNKHIEMLVPNKDKLGFALVFNSVKIR